MLHVGEFKQNSILDQPRYETRGQSLVSLFLILDRATSSLSHTRPEGHQASPGSWEKVRLLLHCGWTASAIVLPET